MSDNTLNRLCPARPSEVKMLGPSLVDQLLQVERKIKGPDQFQKKQEVIAHFERNEPDLYSFFQAKTITPYQLLVKVQKAFENQSDVTFDEVLISKNDAVVTLKRYIPNLQYLHDHQLYTNSILFKELGTSVAIGVVVTGLTEMVGRNSVSNPFLSMELALTETLTVALLSFLWFAAVRNRSATPLGSKLSYK